MSEKQTTLEEINQQGTKREDAYPDYKQTEVEYLSEIPSHWEISKIKYMFGRIESGTTPRRSNKDYYGGETGWVNVEDLNDGFVSDTDEKVTEYALEDNTGLEVYPKGTLLMAIYASIGKLGILDFPSTTNQACCALINPKQDVVTEYVFYTLLALREDLVKVSYGGVQDNISQGIVRNFQIYRPPVEEQKEIIEYLRDKTNKINSLIEEKKSLIELMREREESLITELVTKGVGEKRSFNPTKDEIVSELPAGWEESRLGHITSKLTNGYVGPTKDILTENGVPYIQSTHINNGEINFDGEFFVSEEWSENHQTSKLREGDVLLVQTGDVGESAVVREDLNGANCHALIIARPVGDINSHYLNLFLESKLGKNLLKRTQTGATLKHLNTTRIKDVTIPIPPLDEQEEIVRILEPKRKEFDSMVDLIKQGIECLEEYRSALITEAVTGQIDVRGEV